MYGNSIKCTRDKQRTTGCLNNHVMLGKRRGGNRMFPYDCSFLRKSCLKKAKEMKFLAEYERTIDRMLFGM